MLRANPSLWHASLDQLVPPLGGPILQNSPLAHQAPLPTPTEGTLAGRFDRTEAKFVSPCHHHFHKPLPILNQGGSFEKRKPQALFGNTHYGFNKASQKTNHPFFLAQLRNFPPSIKHETGALGGSSSGSWRASGGSSTESLSAIEVRIPTVTLKTAAAVGWCTQPFPTSKLAVFFHHHDRVKEFLLVMSKTRSSTATSFVEYCWCNLFGWSCNSNFTTSIPSVRSKLHLLGTVSSHTLSSAFSSNKLASLLMAMASNSSSWHMYDCKCLQLTNSNAHPPSPPYCLACSKAQKRRY